MGGLDSSCVGGVFSVHTQHQHGRRERRGDNMMLHLNLPVLCKAPSILEFKILLLNKLFINFIIMISFKCFRLTCLLQKNGFNKNQITRFAEENKLLQLHGFKDLKNQFLRPGGASIQSIRPCLFFSDRILRNKAHNNSVMSET